MPHLRMGSCGLRRHQGSITQTVQEIVDIGNLIQYPLCNLLEPLPVDQQHMIRQGKRNRLPGERLVADHDTGVGLVVLDRANNLLNRMYADGRRMAMNAKELQDLVHVNG